jgi:hypothetical protein
MLPKVGESLSRLRRIVMSLTELWGRNSSSDQDSLMYLFRVFVVVTAMRDIWYFVREAIRNYPDVIPTMTGFIWSLHLSTSLLPDITIFDKLCV